MTWLLNSDKKEKKKISELAKCMEEFPQVLINIEVKEKKEIKEMPKVEAKIKEVEEKLGKKDELL